MKVKIENTSQEMFRDVNSKAISLNVTPEQLNEYRAKKSKIAQEREWKQRVDSSINTLERKVDGLASQLTELIQLLKAGN